jgi:hypothetical protein
VDQEDDVLRDQDLRGATAGQQRIWLLAPPYTGLPSVRSWFTLHHFRLLLSETYFGDVRIELWGRTLPGKTDIAVLPETRFGARWRATGDVERRGGTALLRGGATLSAPFSVRAGDAYTATIDYRGSPPGRSIVTIQTYDAAGHPTGTFPRSKWYDWPVNDVWLSQPFGFVAPPGSVRATLVLHTLWGQSRWRNVAVYSES